MMTAVTIDDEYYLNTDEHYDVTSQSETTRGDCKYDDDKDDGGPTDFHHETMPLYKTHCLKWHQSVLVAHSLFST